MSALTKKNRPLWILLVVSELLLGFSVLFLPFQTLIVLNSCILFFLLFIRYELSYYLFTLTIGNNLLVMSLPSIGLSLPSFLSCVVILITLVPWSFAKMANIIPRNTNSSPLTVPMALLLLWGMVSLFWVQNISDGMIDIVLLVLSYLMFYLSVDMIRNKKIINAICYLLMFAGIISSVFVYYSVYSSTSQYTEKMILESNGMFIYFQYNYIPVIRGSGFGHPNTTAHFFNMVIMLSTGLFFAEENSRKRIGILLIILLMISAHLSTLSKGGVLGLVGGLAVFIIRVHSLRQRILLAIAGSSLMLIVLFAVARIKNLDRVVLEGIASTLTESGATSVPQRLLYWGEGLNNLLDTYGFGTGIGNFYYGSNRGFSHNLYFSVLFTLGIIGLLLWLWICFEITRTAMLSYQRCRSPYYRNMLLGFMAGLVAIFVQGITDLVYFGETIWTFMGIGMAIINIANQDIAHSPRISKLAY